MSLDANLDKRLSGMEEQLKSMNRTITHGFTQILQTLDKLKINDNTFNCKEHIAYHDEIVKREFDGLPCNTIGKVETTNLLLGQLPLAVSMVV